MPRGNCSVELAKYSENRPAFYFAFPSTSVDRRRISILYASTKTLSISFLHPLFYNRCRTGKSLKLGIIWR